jgi:uncharacterized protein (DUF2252 family)
MRPAPAGRTPSSQWTIWPLSNLCGVRRHLLERFQLVDLARKVVGVGSVGTRACIVLLQGRDQQDPLFLQVKQAAASVLEDHLPKSR